MASRVPRRPNNFNAGIKQEMARVRFGTVAAIDGKSITYQGIRKEPDVQDVVGVVMGEENKVDVRRFQPAPGESAFQESGVGARVNEDPLIVVGDEHRVRRGDIAMLAQETGVAFDQDFEYSHYEYEYYYSPTLRPGMGTTTSGMPSSFSELAIASDACSSPWTTKARFQRPRPLAAHLTMPW